MNPNLSNPNLSIPNLSIPNLSNPSLSNPSLSNPSLSNPSLSNPSRKKPSRKFGILALIGLAALASIKLDTKGSAGTIAAAGAPEIECNARDPLSPCAPNVELGYPLGYGLVFTPIMDDFF
jgi:hypothetical protein